ncbi:MAG: DUF222 domain-containing protein [Acidimicrobiales bacterium]
MLSEVVENCDALEAALSGVDPAVLTGDDAADLAERLARTAKRCNTVAAQLGARAAECHTHRRRGYSSAAAWLANTSGTSHADARRALEAARRLADNPAATEATAAAVAAGDISIAQAGEIAAAEDKAPGSEQPLLALARDPKTGLHRLQEEARRLRLEAVNPEDRHAQQVADRHARFWTDESGMGRGQWALPPEIAAAVETRITLEADRLFDKARRQANLDGTQAPTWAACAADALAAIIRGDTIGGAKGYPEVVFVCDIAAYQRGYPDAGEVAQILGGGPVPISVIREAAVAGFIKGVLHDGTDILTVKHWGRYRPAQLQTALNLGAPPLFLGVMCTDCGRRWGTEWDHVDPVAHHGPTSYENLDPRCWPCHLAKTERDRQAGLLGPNPPPPPTRQPTGETSDTATPDSNRDSPSTPETDTDTPDTHSATPDTDTASATPDTDTASPVDPAAADTASATPDTDTASPHTVTAADPAAADTADTTCPADDPDQATPTKPADPAESSQPNRTRPPSRRPSPRTPTQPRSPRRPNTPATVTSRPRDLP